MIKIRNYQSDDYSKVKKLLEEARMFDPVWDSEVNLNGKVINNPRSVLVAIVNNEVVGIVLIIDYGPKLQFLFRLAVKKEFRRQGVASLLIDFAFNAAKKKGVKEVGLYADADDHQLLSYYEKRGFKKSKNKYFYLWKDID